MKKWLVIFGLVFFFYFLIGIANGIAESPPKIENFSIVQKGEAIIIKLSFSGVKGGLETASFNVGYLIERGANTFFRGISSDLRIDLTPHPMINVFMSGDEDGQFEVEMPIAFLPELKSEDRVTYLLSLVDATERKSNTVSCEFTFILVRGQPV